jgi:hypothetical protein
LYEGAAAFAATVLLVGFFSIRAAGFAAFEFLHLLVVFAFACAAGLFFACAAFVRLRRTQSVRIGQTFVTQKDDLVDACLASYDERFEDTTERIVAGPLMPISVVGFHARASSSDIAL